MNNVEAEELTVSKSHQRLRALSTLRNTTAPRDRNLEKTIDLPREQRLGGVQPMSADDIAAITRSSGTYTKLVDESKTMPRPWHRFFARHIDHLVFGIILWAPQHFVRIAYEMGGASHLVTSLAVLGTLLLSVVAAICYEPAMLALFGTTLGKLVFGIKLREQRTGNYLSFWRAFQRVIYVYWYGGMYIGLVPVIGWLAPLIGNTMQYQKLVRDRITTYDEQLFVRYEHG